MWAWWMSGLAVVTLCLGVTSSVTAGEAATPASAGIQREGNGEKMFVYVTKHSNTTEFDEGKLVKAITGLSTMYPLFSEQNTGNSTLPDNKEEESLGPLSLENVKGAAGAMDSQAECLAEVPMRPYLPDLPPVYHCPDADSFRMLGTRVSPTVYPLPYTLA